MFEPLIEFLPQLAELLFFGVGATLLTGVGLYLERFALTLVEAGQPKLGAWVALMGVMAFYFGPYLMGYDEFRTRLRSLGEDGR